MNSDTILSLSASAIMDHSIPNKQLASSMSSAWSLQSSGEVYFTRDVFTDPPTTVRIVPDGAHVTGSDPYVTYSDVEPTIGWLSDRNHAALDICFMHSFHKCTGKAPERDPRTCHQIHIRPAALEQLRKRYANPQRHYFCRTMKANVSEKFAQVLSMLARRKFSLQYLEFKTENVDVTVGSMNYEAEYRRWLLGDTSKASEQRHLPNTTNFISSSNLCWDFAVTGRCSNGATCGDLHGYIDKVLTKDRSIRAALDKMCQKDDEPCGHNVPPPPPPQNVQRCGNNTGGYSGGMNRGNSHGSSNAQQRYQQPNFLMFAPPQGGATGVMGRTSNAPAPQMPPPPPPPPRMPMNCFPNFNVGRQQGILPTPPPPPQLPTFSTGDATSRQPPTMMFTPPAPPTAPTLSQQQQRQQDHAYTLEQANGTMFFISNGPDNCIQLIPLSNLTQNQ